MRLDGRRTIAPGPGRSQSPAPARAQRRIAGQTCVADRKSAARPSPDYTLPMSESSVIVQAGHPVLRVPAAPVPVEMIGTPELDDLVVYMVAAMRQAPGVGLAAPQIGIGLQIIVLEDDEARMARLTPEQRAERGRRPFPLTVILNPELRLVEGERAVFFEGCLSVAGYTALVERALAVEVTGITQRGEPLQWSASGWPARILQHEVDHLRGTLYVDRMLTRSFCSAEEAQARWIDLPVADVRQALNT
jgi:peptide deformylase